jgi:hypothetical protein
MSLLSVLLTSLRVTKYHHPYSRGRGLCRGLGFGGREPPEVHTTEEARGVGGGSPLQWLEDVHCIYAHARFLREILSIRHGMKIVCKIDSQKGQKGGTYILGGQRD